MTDKQEFWRRMPKVMLHEHLDGGLRPDTLLELCRSKDIAVPADNAQDLGRWVSANANSGSLERYVSAFWITVAAMGDVDACERVAYEAAVDAQLDGCVLAEFRMAPLLLEPHGLSPDAAVLALLAGLKRGSASSGIPCGLIVCAMRTDPIEQVERAAKLAVRYADQGVVGFDLAGAELGFPAGVHQRAIEMAREAGLGITLHAGEADSGERVLQAIALGASRIGHGVHIAMGQGAQTRMAQVAAMGARVHFEVCPTSNLHTGAVRTMAGHPLPAMHQAGLSVSVHTDNRLMSMVTMRHELELAHSQLGFTVAQLCDMTVSAARASFLPQAACDSALAAITHWRALHAV